MIHPQILTSRYQIPVQLQDQKYAVQGVFSVQLEVVSLIIIRETDNMDYFLNASRSPGKLDRPQTAQAQISCHLTATRETAMVLSPGGNREMLESPKQKMKRNPRWGHIIVQRPLSKQSGAHGSHPSRLLLPWLKQQKRFGAQNPWFSRISCHQAVTRQWISPQMNCRGSPKFLRQGEQYRTPTVWPRRESPVRYKRNQSRTTEDATGTIEYPGESGVLTGGAPP